MHKYVILTVYSHWDLPVRMLRAGSVMAAIPVPAGTLLIHYTADK